MKGDPKLAPKKNKRKEQLKEHGMYSGPFSSHFF